MIFPLVCGSFLVDFGRFHEQQKYNSLENINICFVTFVWFKFIVLF